LDADVLLSTSYSREVKTAEGLVGLIAVSFQKGSASEKDKYRPDAVARIKESMSAAAVERRHASQWFFPNSDTLRVGR